MSRWRTDFEQHPFQSTWSDVKKISLNLDVDDQTVVTAVEELARFKRVVSYIDGMVAGVDPDLTPRSIWDNFQQQSAVCYQQLSNYVSNRDVGHIVQANGNLDNLLSYLKPYFVLPNDVVQAISKSSLVYVNSLNEYVDNFQKKTNGLISRLDEVRADVESIQKRVESGEKAVVDARSRLLDDKDNEPSILSQIVSVKDTADKIVSELEELHSAFIDNDDSVKNQVEKSRDYVIESEGKIKDSLNSVAPQVSKLDEFYLKIFGEKDASTGKPISGLEYELDRRFAQLSEFESLQNIKHQALFDKIESLLPGATSAGLAGAYGALRRSFRGPIKTYTNIFYASIVLLLIGSIFLSIKSITFSPAFSMELVQIGEWDAALKAVLNKLPFVVPVVWLAIFSSTRRSQYERLQQEYAHKEALAKSYESYKKQLQDLDDDSGELQKELIKKAVEAVSYNASVTLDGKHQEKLPLEHILEKMPFDDLKKILDKVAAVVSPSKSTG